MRERETIEAISRRSIWVVQNSALDRQKRKKLEVKIKNAFWNRIFVTLFPQGVLF